MNCPGVFPTKCALRSPALYRDHLLLVAESDSQYFPRPSLENEIKSVRFSVTSFSAKCHDTLRGGMRDKRKHSQNRCKGPSVSGHRLSTVVRNLNVEAL